MQPGVRNPEVKARKRRRRKRNLARLALAAILLFPVLIVSLRGTLSWEVASRLCGVTRQINIDTGQIRTSVNLFMLPLYERTQDTDISRMLATRGKPEWNSPTPWNTVRIHSFLVDGGGSANLRYRNGVHQLRQIEALLAEMPLPAQDKRDCAALLLTCWHHRDSDHKAEELVLAVKQRKLALAK